MDQLDQTLDKIFKLDKGGGFYLIMAAHVCYELGKFNEVVEIYQKVGTKRVKFAAICAKNKNYEEAITTCNEILKTRNITRQYILEGFLNL